MSALGHEIISTSGIPIKVDDGEKRRKIIHERILQVNVCCVAKPPEY